MQGLVQVFQNLAATALQDAREPVAVEPTVTCFFTLDFLAAMCFFSCFLDLLHPVRQLGD